MKRRTFLQRFGAGAAGLALPSYVSGPRYQGPATRETEVLIYGGGTAGMGAAIQAARLGAKVVVLEPTAWIGGMLTAAGVSALDGNKFAAGGGLIDTFRKRLAAHYGSMEALFTGWISRYGYEPEVGLRVLEDLAAAESGHLTVLHGAEATGYEKVDAGTRRVAVTRADGQGGPTTEPWACAVFLDATEYGDGLALAGLPYYLGRESRDQRGEPAAPPEPDDKMQDLTYVATLRKHPGASDASPAGGAARKAERAYWQEHFRCSVLEDCALPEDADYRARLGYEPHPWEKFITYSELPTPDGRPPKYMLNWPHHANDFPVTPAFFEDRHYRRRHLSAAKLHTLQYVQYMQAELGHPEWQIDEDTYPTRDHLPPLPYIRESRRLINDDIMRQQDVVPPDDGAPRAPWISDSIAVGDYFLDHHHAEAQRPADQRLTEEYPDNAPFQVPPGVFTTERDARFMASEKNIAATHIVNGCTRLQPVVMLMGQAQGAMAAFAARENRPPADVRTPRVQEALLEAGCQLFIMYDVPAESPLFRPVQELALAGVLRTETPTRLNPEKPIPSAWAQRWAERAGVAEYVAPAGDGPLHRRALRGPLRERVAELEETSGSSEPVTRSTFVQALHRTTTSGG
jgi:hypothetical protein